MTVTRDRSSQPAPRPERVALVISQSDLPSDPRVTRQIEWLTSEGWTVDSLGLGDRPVGVRDHFAMAPAPVWTRSALAKTFIHLALPFRVRFRVLSESRLSTEAAERIAAGGYDLVYFNDLYLIPWAANEAVFRDPKTHVHLDMHEYYEPTLRPGTRGRLIASGYFRWVRSFVGSDAFNSRSAVSPAMSAMYANDFGVDAPHVVRNAPKFEELRPSEVAAERIELLHHGGAVWERGLREMVEAMRLVDDRFHLTFMLTGHPQVVAELRELTRGLEARISIVPAVAMEDVASAINRFDLEIMFYQPITLNLRYALPNKLFEAVQGRLGVVVGESPSMVDVVNEFDNGAIVRGWSPRDLAATLMELTPTRVAAMKANSDRAAARLSAENEKENFLASIKSAR